MARMDQKPDPSLLFSGPDAPDESDLYKCVHCGFCLQVCPTYLVTGLETESPRGRIALMKAVNEGRIGMTDSVVRHWDLCIQCRACEVACPSGVPYGNLIEATMTQVERRRDPGMLARLASDLSLPAHYPAPATTQGADDPGTGVSAVWNAEPDPKVRGHPQAVPAARGDGGVHADHLRRLLHRQGADTARNR